MAGKKKKKKGRKRRKVSPSFSFSKRFDLSCLPFFQEHLPIARFNKTDRFGFPFTNENFIGRCYWLRIWYIAASQEGRLFFFEERGKKKRKKKNVSVTYHHRRGSELLSATRTPPFRRPEESVIIWNPLMDVLLDSFVSTVSGCSIKNSDIHWPNELLCHRRGQHHEALSNSKLHFTPACRTTAPPGSLRVLRVLRINHRVISYASNVTSTPMCSKVCSSSIRMDGRLVDCFQNYFFHQMFGFIIIAALQDYYRYRCWRRNFFFLFFYLQENGSRLSQSEDIFPCHNDSATTFKRLIENSISILYFAVSNS